jgi:hypothetical protein
MYCNSLIQNSDFAAHLLANTYATHYDLITEWQNLVEQYDIMAHSPAKQSVLDVWNEKHVKPTIINLAQNAELANIENELGYGT